uniref:Jupiter microtubule associated homolog 2 n=1 Tax=Takifugu rubripes TaxID=31033 RepID=H2S9N6_TAKRU
MTSTNMFQGLDTGSKPSSRVLRPPGGGSSNLFGGFEDDAAASRKPHKMASNIFGSPEQPESNPKRSNPPGGKTSGIFGESEPPAQPQRNMPPGGQTSNIFGGPEKAPVQSPSRGHPNKPKISVELILHCVYLNADLFPYFPHPAPQAVVITPEVKEEPAPPAPTPTKEEPTPVLAPPKPKPKPEPEPEPEPATPATPPPPVPVEKDQAAEPLKNHEPHLGPKPRSHNRVLNPPGGKSSVVFY